MTLRNRRPTTVSLWGTPVCTSPLLSEGEWIPAHFKSKRTARCVLQFLLHPGSAYYGNSQTKGTVTDISPEGIFGIPGYAKPIGLRSETLQEKT